MTPEPDDTLWGVKFMAIVLVVIFAGGIAVGVWSLLT